MNFEKIRWYVNLLYPDIGVGYSSSYRLWVYLYLFLIKFIVLITYWLRTHITMMKNNEHIMFVITISHPRDNQHCWGYDGHRIIIVTIIIVTTVIMAVSGCGQVDKISGILKQWHFATGRFAVQFLVESPEDGFLS